MKLLATILVGTYAYEQPKYYDFLRSLSQKNSGWGAPTGRISALHSLCSPLTTPDNGEVVCDQSTCALVCNQGFVATGKRRTKCRWNSFNNFFWKRTLGECGTCLDLAAPPTGIVADCGFNWMGKKKCTYKCANGAPVVFEGQNFGGITSLCACPRWNNRVCGWNTRKLGKMITNEDLASLTCGSTETTSSPTTQPTSSPTTQPTSAPTTPTTPTSPTTQPGEFQQVSDTIDPTLKSCSNSRSIERIIGGLELDSAQRAHWPWIGRLSMGCGGTIIDNHWVVSGTIKIIFN